MKYKPTAMIAVMLAVGLLALPTVGSPDPDNNGLSSVQERVNLLLEKAVEVAAALPDAYSHATSLLDTANAFRAMGDKDRALQLLQAAFQTAKEIPAGGDHRFSPRVHVLERIASAFLKLSEIESAIQAFGEVYKTTAPDGGWAHPQAQERVASLLAYGGNFDKALEIANRIEHSASRFLAFEHIFEAAVGAGQIERALELARNLEETGSRARALSAVAAALADAQQFDLALQIAQEIGEKPDPRLNRDVWAALNSALYKIASSLVTAGRPDQALQVAAKIDPYEIGSENLAFLAEYLCAKGHLQLGLQAAEMAIGRHRSAAFLEIAYRLMEAGENDTAAQVLERALDASREITDPEPRLDALIRIARSLADVGEKEKALQTLEEALTLVSVPPESLYHDDLLGIARILFRLGEAAKAKQPLDLALQAVLSIKTDTPEALYTAGRALASVANAMAQGGYLQGALSALETAFTLWERITDLSQRWAILNDMLTALQAVAEHLAPTTPSLNSP